MTIEHKDFIGYYYDLYPAGYCQHLINEFNRLEEKGVGSNRQVSENALKHNKNDYQIVVNLCNHDLKPFQGVEDGIEFQRESCDLFFDGIQRCYNDYSTQYSMLRDGGNVRASIMKMQRTGPGGGYHIWHSEQGPGNQANRCVVYMLYVNDLDCDGGETEFLNQRIRVKPKENLM